ncbi:hypothetical protein ABV409_10695 [Flagellimonas sp. DF-77]|uniref:hypothetical protein n=1 Tax=Flagellimonas algarum TaxID=3230298 RepID=UPI00339B562C
MKLTLERRIAITATVAVLVWGHVLWDHLHEGIPTHYLFHDKDMPGIPNWIGAICLPFFTWFLLFRIKFRVNRSKSRDTLSLVFKRFALAAMVAIAIAICFMNGIEIPMAVLLGILGLGLFFPLYYSEFLLGWVLGSALTFGAVIPMGFGSIFALVCWLLFQLGRLVVKLIGRKRP